MRERLKKLIEFTYGLEMDEIDDGRIRREVFKQLIKFTYTLETEEEEGIGDQMRGIQIIDLIHVLSGDGEEDGMRCLQVTSSIVDVLSLSRFASGQAL